MFDTKIYHNLGCECLGCYKIGCNCDCHIGQTHFRTACQELIEKNIYSKGFYDGQKEAFETFEKEKMRLRDCSDQQKFVEMLEDLIRKIKGLKD